EARPPVAEPLLAPSAASTATTVPVVVLSPAWPVAVAAPLVLVAVPVLVTVRRDEADEPLGELPIAPPPPPPVDDPGPPIEPLVVVLEPIELLMLVVASPMPSPLADPVSAPAKMSLSDSTFWWLEAVVSPLNDFPTLPIPCPSPVAAVALPLFAPPAASTVPTVPL